VHEPANAEMADFSKSGDERPGEGIKALAEYPSGHRDVCKYEGGVKVRTDSIETHEWCLGKSA
jgi:hypothetical protein